MVFEIFEKIVVTVQPSVFPQRNQNRLQAEHDF